MLPNSFITLPTGQMMPVLGYGTWQAKDIEFEKAIDAALEAGYRLIDTAPVYENEKIVGKVLKKWLDSGKIKRSELFIISKLPPLRKSPGSVEKWIKRSLEKLQLDYVDLYLIHTPFSFEEVGEELHPVNENGEIIFDPSTDNLKAWADMEKQVAQGHTKAIGLSNFNIEQIKKILSHAKVPIANLQIELHVYLQQTQLVEFCKNNKISITAYSPLGSRGLIRMLGKEDTSPDLLVNPVVLEIAQKYEKTP